MPQHWSVEQTIDYLRDDADLTTDFWEIFAVDPAHQPIGSCQLSWILRTPRDIALADVMKRERRSSRSIWIRKKSRFAFKNTR